MKIKLGELSRSIEAFQKLMISPLENSRTKYRLGKLSRRFQPIIEDFFEARKPLIEKHGMKVNGQMQISPDMKNWQKYLKELEPLLDEEEEIEIPRITLQDLKGELLNAAEMGMLDWLIKDEK